MNGPHQEIDRHDRECKRGSGSRERKPSFGRSLSRRGFLATGVAAAIAGCGYRPGGGDIRWRRGGVGGLGSDRVEVTDGTLFAVSESVHTFDLEIEDWITGGQVSAHRTSDGRERWTETFRSELSAHAVGAGGVAVALDGTLLRIGPGGERWRASIGRDVGALGLSGERAYGYTTASTLLAVSGGEVLWDAPVDTGDSPRVGATESVAVIGGQAGIAAFDTDGTRRWRRGDVAVDSLTVADHGVYVTDDGDLLALSLRSGETRWSLDGECCGSYGPPLVTDDAVFYGTERDPRARSVRVFDRSGERRWSIQSPVRLGGRLPVAVDDNGVYAVTQVEVSIGADEKPRLEAFDHDGTRRWSVEHDRVSAGPFVAGSGVLVGAGTDLVCHVR